MEDAIVNKKRIAKNTLILYLRMAVIMLTALYTSRVVLQALGEEDYGIYNVVGGVVAMLGFLNGTLSTASSRYITVALGQNDKKRMNHVFSSVMQANALLCLVILLLGETVGLWFLCNKMTIPDDRMHAAHWVYQLSILTVVINIISVPYNATIIAHEKMKAFAYITLFDTFVKLLIAYLIMMDHSVDKLILYAVLLFLLQLSDRILYGAYCFHHFPETSYVHHVDKPLLREMMGFISWSAYGSFASVCFNHGLNILLNLFFTPAVNAARGIACQVQYAVTSFNTNFHVAFNPALIKSVAQHKLDENRRLMILSTKISFFLLCILGLPVISEAHYVLALWLVDVPDYTVPFMQLMLVISIWQSMATSLRVINQAEGHIKKFQLYECTYLLIIVPLSYLFLRLGYPPYSVFLTHLFVELTANILRIRIVLPKIEMPLSVYFRNTYTRFLPIFLLPFVIPTFIQKGMKESFIRFVVNLSVIEIVLFTTMYLIGMDKGEKSLVKSYIKKVRNRCRHFV